MPHHPNPSLLGRIGSLTNFDSRIATDDNGSFP